MLDRISSRNLKTEKQLTMHNFKTLLFLLALTVGFASCSSDDGPEVNILAPVDGNSYKMNTSFDMELTMTDDEGLSSLSITNPELGINVLESFGGEAAINYTLTVNLGSAPEDKYEFVILVTDTDGNTEEEKVEIEVIE